MSRVRRGWTLHEMLISLSVLAGIVALSVQMAVGQLRFFHGIGEITATRSQMRQATAAAAAVLRQVSATGGDILAAQDSAIELRAAVGTAVVCQSSPGRVTIPVGTTAGNTLAAYFDAPKAGDRAAAFLEDSAGGTWLTFRVASPPVSAGACHLSSEVAASWTLDLVEQLAIPQGTVVRFTRPLRFSLYRASDRQWYLGARDWNGAAQRFNSIQPVAGPLQPYGASPSSTGLRFDYYDAGGDELLAGADVRRIARVVITARALSGLPVRVPGLRSRKGDRYADSSSITVALRNAR